MDNVQPQQNNVFCDIKTKLVKPYTMIKNI